MKITMNITNIWTQTASGRAFRLLAPDAAQVDFVNDVAPQLARQARFNGAAEGFYSVAQHCVHGADALYQETRRADLAAYFLLHDAHEAYIGDIPTPVTMALATLGRMNGVGQEGRDIGHVLEAFRRLIDVAIWKAAGLSPPSVAMQRQIESMDLRMLATEKRDLMRPSQHAWNEQVERAEPVRGPRIKPFPWPKAADLWLSRLQQYCPAALRRAA